MIIFAWIAAYFVIGIMAIIGLDMMTGRVRSRIKDSSVDTQLIIASQAKAPIGTKTSLVVTLTALWIFWPAAIGSAIAGLFKKEEHDDKS